MKKEIPITFKHILVLIIYILFAIGAHYRYKSIERRRDRRFCRREK